MVRSQRPLCAATLWCGVEALDQLGCVLAEEALAEHDADVGVAAAVQDVGRVVHQQRESVGCHRPQLSVIQKGEELRSRSGGMGGHSGSNSVTAETDWQQNGLPCQSADWTGGGT